ncbi:hypothetical protein P154DRAFT_19448 [Amniculicola lignicola CBS 123094]|uniref:Uncharacterized protein n=1 Tax=Amniculicola lignicola CBS 123094 TaxID=1392246 RepID=A0A6A5WTA5_9PLEO|nr:hypothetical protein P154DRAFT_19448 [Amniculicola lignicola CBS 123094]
MHWGLQAGDGRWQGSVVALTGWAGGGDGLATICLAAHHSIRDGGPLAILAAPTSLFAVCALAASACCLCLLPLPAAPRRRPRLVVSQRPPGLHRGGIGNGVVAARTRQLASNKPVVPDGAQRQADAPFAREDSRALAVGRWPPSAVWRASPSGEPIWRASQSERHTT